MTSTLTQQIREFMFCLLALHRPLADELHARDGAARALELENAPARLQAPGGDWKVVPMDRGVALVALVVVAAGCSGSLSNALSGADAGADGGR